MERKLSEKLCRKSHLIPKGYFICNHDHITCSSIIFMAKKPAIFFSFMDEFYPGKRCIHFRHPANIKNNYKSFLVSLRANLDLICWHKRATFQRSAFGRLTAGNDVVATIIINVFSFFPPVFFSSCFFLRRDLFS